ncbi:hypothetical protein UFOVP785_77 [uncultured Caudovirales phage]|uniref:Uncharacterized protein n=1 Tax=uncultured Caudovirales phage TaxID=2100421 RepID=A0A6J5NUH9_9CAUD|nr:hypothetical protein UFOVP785_77 [uncultured Caudovirales phage]
MESDWEEYTPTVGEPYSPCTQWYDGFENAWDDESELIHKEHPMNYRYRRPKQSTTVSEVQQLRAAVKELTRVVLHLQKAANSADSDHSYICRDNEDTLYSILSDLP